MGKKVSRQIKWHPKALYSFIDILDHIKEDSPTNAKRVKTRINNIIKTIPSNPEMFREDKPVRADLQSVHLFQEY